MTASCVCRCAYHAPFKNPATSSENRAQYFAARSFGNTNGDISIDTTARIATDEKQNTVQYSKPNLVYSIQESVERRFINGEKRATTTRAAPNPGIISVLIPACPTSKTQLPFYLAPESRV